MWYYFSLALNTIVRRFMLLFDSVHRSILVTLLSLNIGYRLVVIDNLVECLDLLESHNEMEHNSIILRDHLSMSKLMILLMIPQLVNKNLITRNYLLRLNLTLNSAIRFSQEFMKLLNPLAYWSSQFSNYLNRIQWQFRLFVQSQLYFTASNQRKSNDWRTCFPSIERCSMNSFQDKSTY